MGKIPDLAAIRDWCLSKFQPIGSYAVPIATETTIGGVKPDGTTITIDADGTIHAVSTQELEESILGGES